MRNSHRNLVGKPERKTFLGRYKHTWKDNIKVDVTETGYSDMDSIIVVRYSDN
jgi:hypothetical protein